MQLPAEVKDIRARYVAKFPVPQGEPGEAFEESARQWSIRFAEQVAYDLGPLWGMKRADPNRPISKDTLSLYGEDGAIIIWDLLMGTGTGKPRLVDDPQGHEITGQVFVPVTPTNHLGLSTSRPPIDNIKPPIVNLPPADLGPVVSQLSAILSKIDMLQEQGEAVQASVSGYGQSVERIGDLINALVGQQQAVVDRLTALESKPCTVPDGAIRLYGRKIGDVDFPGN